MVALFFHQSSLGRPWGHRLPEHDSPISLQNPQEEVEVKAQTVGK